MGDYNFSTLGTDNFEQMAQAIAVSVLGSNVKPLGRGRDKGRDAWFRGLVNHQHADGSGQWTGYGVVQAKYRMRDGEPAQNATWVKAQIRNELKKWLPGPNGEQPQHSDPPEYWLLVCNASLSPEASDECMTELRDWAGKLKMKDWDIWSREELSRFLDNRVNIRQTYLHFIVPGDVIAALENAYKGTSVAEIGRQVSVSAAVELRNRQWVRLGESGLETEEKFLLSAVAVDLQSKFVDEPSNDEAGKLVGTVQAALEAGNQSLKHSADPRYRGVLIVGGPGQGKSTLAQIISQAYRGALLEGNTSLTREQKNLVQSLKAALTRNGLGFPAYRRWPAYIELSKFGDEMARDDGYTLLRYMASQVRADGKPLKPAQLLSWRGAWPWVVVLDGLDEVANPDVRDRVVDAINEFITECNSRDVDLLIIATTRPQGYRDEFGSFELLQLELQQLEADDALRYGSLLVSSRHSDDDLTREKVLSRFRDATRNELMSRLMATPLQVTIIATLLERMNRVPDSRHALFEAYYDTIYARESVKAGALGDLLSSHRALIDFVHEQVGLYLHVQAERPGRAEALLREDALLPLIVKRLEADEYDRVEAEKLAHEIVRAVRNRVVLIVGVRGDLVGFEVRSLQEYLAARALTIGSPDQILTRLETLVPSSHWRNVWLLAAARLQKNTDPTLIDSLLLRLEDADSDSRLAAEVGPGQRLALDLLEDGFAANVPRVRRALIRRATGMLEHWPDSGTRRLAKLLATEMKDKRTYDLVRVAAHGALHSAGAPRAAAVSLLLTWQRGFGNSAALAHLELASARGWRPERNAKRPREALSDVLGAKVVKEDLRWEQLQRLDAAIRDLSRVSVPMGITSSEVATVAKNGPFPSSTAVTKALHDDDLLERLLDVLQSFDESEGAAAVLLRHYVIARSEAHVVGVSPSISQPGVGLFPL